MKLFKDENNDIYAFDDDQVAQDYGSDLESVTDAEAKAINEAKEKERFDALSYTEKRVQKYPSIGDQLDMQYHDELDGTTTWKDAIAKVKSDNPKE